jgi:hypothetical protein
MKNQLIFRLTAGLLLLCAIYLVGANLLLSMQQTHDFVNRLQPEQFSVSWERAWSWYPFRVELHGVHADGQTNKEQWQVDARSARASLSLLALLQGRIDIFGIHIQDVDLRLRPLRKPGVDDSSQRAFFPVVSHRDPDVLTPDAIGGQQDKPGKTLILSLEDLHLRGEHSFWVAGAKGEASGSLSGNFSMNTDGGRIALDAGTLDIRLQSLSLLGVDEAFSGASIQGTLTIPSMLASDLTQANGLRRADVDARIDLPVNTLDFIEPLVGGLGKASISGKGHVRGRLHQSAGELRSDTDLRIEASELILDLPPYSFDGDGVVLLRIHPANTERAELDVHFGHVNGLLHPAGQKQPVALFSGRDLQANLQGDPNSADPDRLSLKIRIPEVSVADMAVYDALIPTKTGLELLGGQGRLAATIALQSTHLDMALDLSSAAARVRYDALEGRTNLNFKLRARAQRDTGTSLDISGTHLSLDDTRLSRDATATEDAQPWSAGLDIIKGSLKVPVGQVGEDQETLDNLRQAIAAAVAEQEFSTLLNDADGEMEAQFQVSSLDWIAALLGRPLDMTLDGRGQIDAHLLVESGQAVSGTHLVVQPEAVSLGIMQHLIAGQGKITLSVEPQNTASLLRLQVALSNATMRRIDEQQPNVEQVALQADIRVPQAADALSKSAQVDLKIPSARVTDMSVFNAYLPENTPVVIASGEADLLGELHTDSGKVEGALLLTASDIKVKIDAIDLSGDLRLTGLIVGGDPEAMRFDVTGSSLLFDNFDVTGASASHDGSRWGARIQLDQSQVVWNKPMELSTKANLTVTDTRPFVAMLENARGEHDWISELLTLSDLAGNLHLTTNARGAVLHDAFFGSDTASISARGLSRANHREALLLVRYKRFTGALALQDGQSRFSILGARERFANYLPDKTALPERGIKIAPGKKQEVPEVVEEPRRKSAPISQRERKAPHKEAANPFLDNDF